ncbi:Carboxypeptidase regulatory-like domain-containing protein [Bryocella elongata]|uniref:Carboxypeptidase regulatory-like domain-containing protein n=1 Tax=Bryocella elongata TaxID=863522 RepID=A0A1H6AIX4_9BACT|nr:carboxypeptidase-like regulatory domain-containing protein [Bryocella elongata]SEG48658.1 Carboxypeptidase regulatory-like domain-containing protein [Bryocella elongata]
MPSTHKLVRAGALALAAGAAACAQVVPAAPQAAAAAQAPAAAAQNPAAAQSPAPAQGGTIRGKVVAGTTGRPGGIPLPGVSVTATNTLTGRKYTSATDVDGNYEMKIPRNGRYVVKAELTGFTTPTQEVVLTGVEAQAATQGIVIAAKATDFGLELASRAAAAEAAQTRATARTGNGTQSLALAQGDTDVTDASSGAGNAGAALPSLSGLSDSVTGPGAAAADDAIAVNGQAGQTNALAGVSEDDMRDRIQNAMDNARQNGMLPPGVDANQIVAGVMGGMMGGGGFGGPGGGGPGGGGGRGGRGGGGGGGFGNFRNFNPAQPHGSLQYQGADSALNSSAWSPTQTSVPKPPGFQNNFNVTLAASPYIPGLTKPNTKQFMFLNISGKKNLTPEVFNGIVPTAAERAGDFSASTLRGGSSAQPVTLYNPTTNGATTIPNNCLVALCGANAGAGLTLSPQAVALLNYYPLPNIAPNSVGQNYQTVTNQATNSIAINTRYVRTLGQATNTPFGRFGGGGGGRGNGGGGNGRNGQQNQKPTLRQNINVAYNYSHSANDVRQIFVPLGGATSSDGNGLNVGYTISYGRLSNNASVNWNRLSSETHNYFTNTANNPSATAGITVPNNASGFANPRFYNGLPSIGLSGFTGLSNTTPTQSIQQTIAFSDFVAWRHAKHNFRFGLDVRRVHADTAGGNTPLGSFSFTGYATASAADRSAGSAGEAGGSGDAFADFLLGSPQTTSIQANLYKTYLRENVYDWYVMDDWRLSSHITVNAAVRYEYFGPYTEKNNRLVNLDHDAGLKNFDVVLPGANGTYGGKYPSSLVNPDRTMYAPRIGVAYRLPNKGLTKQAVLRGGYGINYNTGQYAVFAQKLSGQPPFAVTQTNTLSNSPNITLANGFPTTSTVIENNWAVDKNYRLGMVQLYNLNLQKTVGMGIVLNVGYNGTKASNLDVVGSPNGVPTSVAASGNLLPAFAPFDYEESAAWAHSNQLVVSAQKRMQKGIALGATYTYMHAIDNASGVGGAVGAPVQNLFNLAAEEGNSSFDQRHNLSGNYVLELPFGPNRAFFNKGGKVAYILDGWNLSGSFVFASGTYYTPQYAQSSVTALSGNVYIQRPNRVQGQSTKGAGTVKQWFNTAAFTAPLVNGLTVYGTASPGSIEGPGTLTLNSSLSRTFTLGSTRSLESRLTVSNPFNTVQYSGISTSLNSNNYGQVTSAAGMRSITYQMRYRF